MSEQPPSPSTGRGIFREWFDCMEDRLVEDAKRAGLFDQPTLTGQAREFIVKEVLEAVLPENLEIGSGRVLRASGEPSAQIDVVVFDKHFPSLRMPGGTNLYPIEGVVATIEIKSHLDKSRLHQAMNNCMSVLNLAGNSCFDEVLHEGMLKRLIDRGISLSDAREQIFWRCVAPRTYIFAFDGIVSKETFNKALDEWLVDNDLITTPIRPLLPSMIICGQVTAISWGDPVGVKGGTATDGLGVTIASELVQRDAYMLVGDTQRRFGLLLTHLLWHIDVRRVSLVGEGFCGSIHNYLPFEEYLKEYVAHCQVRVFQRNYKIEGANPPAFVHNKLVRTEGFQLQ